MSGTREELSMSDALQAAKLKAQSTYNAAADYFDAELGPAALRAGGLRGVGNGSGYSS